MLDRHLAGFLISTSIHDSGRSLIIRNMSHDSVDNEVFEVAECYTAKHIVTISFPLLDFHLLDRQRVKEVASGGL
jgi:hypothetical protein